MKSVFAFIVLFSMNTFAQVDVVKCSNEGTNLDVVYVDDGAGNQGYIVSTTNNIPETVNYVVTAQIVTTDSSVAGQEYFLTPAIDVNKIIEVQGVIAEGIMVQIFGANAYLAQSGVIQVLTCTWAGQPAAAPVAPATN